MIIVTGGAGFIGSALVWGLNQRGITDISIVDDVDSDEKEHNIGHLRHDELISPEEFHRRLLAGELKNSNVTAILHMGACSSTMEKKWDYLLENNVEYSKDIIRWCVDNDVRCVYASSAATYGDGSRGYSDDHSLFNELQPLNLYGKSKLMVDIWARDAGYLDKVVGLRYFNVFGPNEWHKGDMRSVVAKKFDEASRENKVTLFKSNDPEYADGEQRRDFIYVKDAVAATLFFLDIKVGGVYNIGTGEAHSWREAAAALLSALGKPEIIEYIDMPGALKGQYQNFTQADIKKLRSAGYQGSFMALEESISDYVREHLMPHRHLGQ